MTAGAAAPAPAATLRESLLAALALAATIAIAFALVPHGYAYEHTWEYERMIGGGRAAAPFAHRILVPALLVLVPLPPRAAFLLATLAATFLTLLALYHLCRARGIAHRPALVASQLAGFSYPVALYLGFWGMVDPVANLFVATTLLGMAQGSVALAGLSLLLGTLAKETTLLLVPLVAWWLLRRPAAPRTRIAHAVLLLAPLAAFLLVRAGIATEPGRWDIRGWDDLVYFWRTLWAMKAGEMGAPVWLAGVLLRSYGFFWATAALGVGDRRAWRGVGLYLMLASVALCAAATDWARMLGFGFVAVFLATAAFLDRLERAPRAAAWSIALLATAALQCWITLAPFAPMSPALERWHPVITVACVVVGTIVALAAWRSGGRPGRYA